MHSSPNDWLMSHHDNNSLDGIPLDVLTQVHEICEQFEWALQTGTAESVPMYLARIEPRGRVAGLRELLGLELEYLRAGGQRPDLQEYLARYPDDVETVQQVWQDSPGYLATATLPPTQFGDFLLLREIGRGGMGVVYLAKQDSLDRQVAIKVLSQATVLDPARRVRFQREARSAAALQHPNIVPVYGVGQHGDFHYYVMRFVDGLSLDEMIQQLATGSDPQVPQATQPTEPTSPLPATPAGVRSRSGSDSRSGRGITTDRAHYRNLARIIRQAAEGLQYAHDKGFLHRDIKPSNLLLDGEGKLWITDFGLAKSVTDSQQLTQTGDVAGTLKYMAPETFQGNADFRSDIYGLGLTMYELLTLKSPYSQTNHGRLIDEVLRGSGPPPPRKINPLIPRDLETCCLKCIQRDASKRYSSAADLAEDLRRYLNNEPIQARPVSVWNKSLLWAKRKPLIVGLMLFALLTTVGMFAGLTVAFMAAAQRAESETLRANAEQARSASESARAESQRLARIRESKLRRKTDTSLVFSRVALAERSWLAGEIAAARRYLAQCIPQPGASDLRGWEWEYVNGLCNAELHVLAHNFWVNSVAFDPTGRWLATAAGSPGQGVGDALQDGELNIWDVATGQRIAKLIAPEESAAAVQSVEFSADGRWLVASDAARIWRVWDTRTWQPTPIVTAGIDAACLPDTEIFAVLRPNGELVHYNLGSNRGPTLIRAPTAAEHDARQAGFGTDKRYVVMRQSHAPTADVIDSLTGDKLATVAAPIVPGILKLGPGGKHLVAASHLLHVASGEDLGHLAATLDSETIFLPNISPNGDSLAWTGYPRNQLLVRAINDPDAQRIFDTHTGDINSIAFSADSQRLATGSTDNTVRVWRVTDESRREICVLRGHSAGVRAVAFSPDGKTIASASQDGTVRLWDYANDPRGQLIGTNNSSGEAINHFSLSADGRELMLSRYNSSYRIDVETAQVSQAQWHAIRQNPRIPRSDIQLAADGQLLMGVASTDDRIACVWRIDPRPDAFDPQAPAPAAGEPAISFAHHTQGITCVAASRDGQTFASLAAEDAAEDAELMLWDATGTLQQSWRTPSATCLVLSDSGDLVAASGADHVVRVWDRQSKRLKFSSPPQDEQITCLTLNEDATLLAATTLTGFAVWQITSGERKCAVHTASQRLTGAAFSPDGQRLATIGYDEGVVRLWDASTGESVMTLRGFARPRPAAYGFLARVAFSRDGRRIISNNWDASFNIWSAPDSAAKLQSR